MVYHLFGRFTGLISGEDQQINWRLDSLRKFPWATVESMELKPVSAVIRSVVTSEIRWLDTLINPEIYFDVISVTVLITHLRIFRDDALVEWGRPNGSVAVHRLKETQPWLQAWLESLPSINVNLATSSLYMLGLIREVDQWQDFSRRDFGPDSRTFHTLPNKTGTNYLLATPIGRLNDDGLTHHVWHEGDLLRIDGGAARWSSIGRPNQSRDPSKHILRSFGRTKGGRLNYDSNINT